MTDRLPKQMIAGAILAGGKASRMGGLPKGTLENNRGVSVVERLIRAFRCSGIREIVILANDPHPYQKYGVEIIPDQRAGLGPIGGLETGLMHLADRCGAVMFVPCDMPNLTAKEMQALKEAFIDSDALVVCAETTVFFWHPLCAVVHNDLRPRISSAVDGGQRKVQELWKQLKAQRVRFADETAFFNMNSLSEAEEWRKG